MSKEEERALEKYPLMSEEDKEALEALKYVGMECNCASEYNKAQEAKQAYFIKGYHQAEKDLELSWEDIKLIYNLVCTVSDELGIKCMYTNIYKEVLKRFNKERK